MSDSKFFSSLLAVTTFVGLVVMYLHGNPKFQPYMLMSICGMTVFILLNVAVYYLAKNYSNKSLDQKYMGLIYRNLAMKFVIAITIPIGFYYHYQQPAGSFILPFLFIYISYTIYETWMLNKMAVMRR
jgi:hypothetical protein